MLGDAFLHQLPHAFGMAYDITFVDACALIGYYCSYS